MSADALPVIIVLFSGVELPFLVRPDVRSGFLEIPPPGMAALAEVRLI